MKKLVILAVLILGVMAAFSQEIKRDGDKIWVEYPKSERVKSDTLYTGHKDQNDRPIYIVKNTGHSYVPRISKSGNYYRAYCPVILQVEIAKEMKIEYKETPKKKEE